MGSYLHSNIFKKFKLYKVTQNYESSVEATSLLSLVASLALTYIYNIGHAAVYHAALNVPKIKWNLVYHISSIKLPGGLFFKRV